MTLVHKRHSPIKIPVGANTEMIRPETFVIEREEGAIAIQINSHGVYQKSLARDLATFVSGGGPAPLDHGHDIERYFFWLAALPFGIPFLTFGGALWVFFAFGLYFACYTVFSNEKRTRGTRLAICAAIVAAGYIFVFTMLVLTGATYQRLLDSV